MANELSPHVSLAEYQCKCCGKLPPDLYRDGQVLYCYENLFDAFEAIRTEWGEPIAITSGYRCAKHNAEVGGEPGSVHLVGLALDLHIPKADTERFVRLVRDSGRDLRIGWKKYTDPLVHIDVGFLWWPRHSEFLKAGIEW